LPFRYAKETEERSEKEYGFLARKCWEAGMEPLRLRLKTPALFATPGKGTKSRTEKGDGFSWCGK